MKQSPLKIAVISCVFIIGIGSSQLTRAVGLGEAKVQSSIGQNLKVFIPIELGSGNFDINQISVVDATTEQRTSLGINNIGGFNSKLNYQVIAGSGRQGIIITTNTPVNEPYVNMAFQVNHAGSSIVKAVPVLLDLPGQQTTQGTSTNQVVFPYVQTAEPVYVEQTYEPILEVSSNEVYSTYETVAVESNQGQISSEVSPSYGADIMGPYDWASEGFIPQSFGPVLDGQSLWRVARRINKAMGVSVDQMMWGLYRENPQAFSGKTVDTLTSGVTLKIPQESLVRELTERQAIAALANNTGTTVGQGVNVETAESTYSEDVPSETETGKIEQTPVDVVDSSNSSSEQSGVIGGMVISPIDRQILDTLSSTVIELQKQLLDKDLEIEFLRGELEKYTGVANLEGGTNDSELGADGEISIAKGEIPSEMFIEEQENDSSIEEANIDEEVVVVNEQPSIDLLDAPVEKTEALIDLDRPDISLTQNSAESTKKNNLWYWLLAGLAALVASLFLFRGFLLGLFNRFFSNDDEVVLNIPSVVDTPSRTMTSRPVDYAPEVKMPNDDYIPNEVSFEEDEFLIDEGHGIDIEEINLSDRIKEFLRAGDFEAASKTVEFADETGMDVNYLDFCRLEISAAKEDKSEFAKVFNRVNRRINDFHPDIQNKITKLHRQMFDSDSIIDFGFKED